MFSKNFVLAVKVNGKILREIEDIVYLPFGAEYTILLKNVSTRKAKVKVSVDGQDVTENVFLVVDPNESLELKRFIKNGNMKAGNAFKFIEKTSQIEEYRGNKAEDGLITVTYLFEREPAALPPYNPYSGVRYKTFVDASGGNILRSRGLADYSPMGGTAYASSSLHSSDYGQLCSAGVLTTTCGDGVGVAMNFANNVSYTNTSGITAPGAPVKQEFHSASDFTTDGVSHSMTLQLKGDTGDKKKVTAAIVVKKVQRCTMCGTNTKQTAKFCHKCGASVEIV
jgi:hypothetical protein